MVAEASCLRCQPTWLHPGLRSGEGAPRTPISPAQKPFTLRKLLVLGCPVSPGGSVGPWVGWGCSCCHPCGLGASGCLVLVSSHLFSRHWGGEDLRPLPLLGFGAEARQSTEVSCWHAGCWGEDRAERSSSGRHAHTTRITPANPVADLTYIWGRGGSKSAAADGDLKSLGSRRLQFCCLSRGRGWAARWLLSPA